VVPAVFLGLLCLVLPGLFLFARFALFPFVLAHRGGSAWSALGTSWRLTRDHVLLVLACWLPPFLLARVASLVFGGPIVGAAAPGTTLAWIWTALALAALYGAVTEREEGVTESSMPSPHRPRAEDCSRLTPS